MIKFKSNLAILFGGGGGGGLNTLTTLNTLILPTILLQFNYILGEFTSLQSNELVINLSVETFVKACLMSYFHGKTVGKNRKWLGEFTVNHC